jgi:acyl-coenzyme A thioesterase 13
VIGIQEIQQDTPVCSDSARMASNSTLIKFKSMIGIPMENSPSPFGRWLSGYLTDVQYGSLTAVFEVRKEMTNPFDTLHGGIISAIMDDMIGATVYSMELGGFHSNVNFSVDFLDYTVLGEKLIVTTSVNRVGNKIVNASCLISVNRDKQLVQIAKGNSNLLKVDRVE